jgi:glycosyltransferase involved in cell wall biosynthesis
MTPDPTFSVVIPSFNQALWLQQSISSVLEQDQPNVELIVMDGGSSDGSKAILERNGDRITYWQSQPDGGQTAALNAGIARISGDISGWINSDDFYLPGAFAAATKRFAQPDRPDIVFGYSIDVDADGRLLRENRHDDFSPSALLTTGLDIRGQAMFWRSDLNAKVFPLDESLRFCMDLQLIVRLAAVSTTFARIPEYLGAFRVHGGSKTATIPEVCEREHRAVMRDAESLFNIRASRSKVAALLMRRLRFTRRGEWKYALLGGGTLIPRRARNAAELALRWARPR